MAVTNDSDDKPSIAELQRLCCDGRANHDARFASAVPVLLEIAEAALAWRDQRARDAPFAARDRLIAALTKVRP